MSAALRQPWPEPTPTSATTAAQRRRSLLRMPLRLDVQHELRHPLANRIRAFVASLPDSAGRCHEMDPRWLAVLQDGLGHQPVLVTAWRGDEPVGVLPLAWVKSRLFGRFLVSLPYLNRGGIAAVDQGTAAALFKEAREIARMGRANHLELRHHRATLPTDPSMTERADKLRMVMSLPEDADSLWEEVGGKVRNQIRKAERTPFQIRFGGHELLNGFYRVFAENMRDLGTPVYPKALFRATLSHFPDEAELVLVTLDEEPIGGALLVHDLWSGQSLTQVPSASTLRRFNSTNANMWMYHRMLMRAIERGSTRFDFGRSSPGAGTWRFKKQWGAAPEPTCWQQVVFRGDPSAMRPDHPKHQRRIERWQKLPLWMANMAGPMIVRGIP